ncbi:hypothetical protein [Bacillus sp. OV322]|nr:hypothetical protein [Bacillus sp. OV322]
MKGWISGLTGKVITPEDKEYDVLRRDYNPEKIKFPYFNAVI